MKTRKIKWDKQAQQFFRETLQYIRKDSPQNADKVKKKVLKKIGDLSQKPETHPPDKYKSGNTGNYRAFEIYRLRVGYLVKKEEIIITRIRHTSQEPLEY